MASIALHWRSALTFRLVDGGIWSIGIESEFGVRFSITLLLSRYMKCRHDCPVGCRCHHNGTECSLFIKTCPAPPPTRPGLAAPPPSHPGPAAPPPSHPGPAAPPPSHPGPAASPTRVRVPRFAVNLKWSPTEEIRRPSISCDFRWSFGNFIKAFDGLNDEGFVAGMGYRYKIGNRGSEVILMYEDEYRVILGRGQKAPKGTGVLIRPTSSVRSLPLQFGTLR